MAKGKKRQQESESEEIEDVMAWGKSKNNYYREDEDEYSEASEEQEEARQIYDNQLDNLNQDEYYEVPADEDSLPSAQEDDNPAIDQDYIQSEILWATELAKLFSAISDQQSAFRKKIYDSYLLILLCLKEFNIPYIEQHPLVSYLPNLRSALKRLENDIPRLYKEAGLAGADEPSDAPISGEEEGDEEGDDEEGDEEGEEEEEGESDMDEAGQQEMEQADDIDFQEEESEAVMAPAKNKKKKVALDEEGIQIYESIKQKKEEQKKAKKQEQKQKRLESLPKEKFRVVKESEGRLANEKMIKNKGLIKKRKKIDGNSRVKLRQKYRKALIKRTAKGFVGVRQNPGRHYEGENKVLMGKIASRKL